MDTLDKLFQLQQSLSNDLSTIAKQQRKARSKAEKAKLEWKYNVIYQVYQQVCELVIPY